MRALVTGAGGQLGTDLVEAFARGSAYQVVGASRAHLDVADRDAVRAAVAGVAPDVVVHAGAWTEVDACEADPERAWRVNAVGTRHVAEACASAGAHLVYVSTDYVFDGTLDRPYHEWDVPAPRSVYGATKLAGEREAAGGLPGTAIVRTSWVCGRHGTNVVKTVLRLLGEARALRFVDDQRGCPTFTEDLARAVVALAVDRRPGVFHLTNQGQTTWYGLAREVVALAGADPARVEPIATAELDPPRAAPRPANSVLDNAAWRASGLAPLADYHQPLAALVAALVG
ncbi:MAG: dTDP-4-dehydrorhamnose reductase [Acidimicrobiales bacterium]